MRLEDLRDDTRKKAEAARAQRTRVRLASGEKPNAKRMAEVAGVYTLKQWPLTIEDAIGVDEHAVKDDQVEVHVQVDQAAEPLHERDRARVRRAEPTRARDAPLPRADSLDREPCASLCPTTGRPATA